MSAGIVIRRLRGRLENVGLGEDGRTRIAHYWIA
jgi:hypothetical protein